MAKEALRGQKPEEGQDYLDRQFYNAITMKSKFTALELLRRGASPDARFQGYTPLGHAIFNNDKDLVRFLVRECGASPNLICQDKTSPLEACIVHKVPEILEVLIASGADVNLRSAFGGTPLHHCADYNDKGMALRLFYHGANPRIADDRGCLPSDRATRHGFEEIRAFLLELESRHHAQKVKTRHRSRGRQP